MTPELLARLREAQAAKRPVALLTRLSDGEQRLWPDDGAPGPLAEAAEAALREDETGTVALGDERWFVHPHNPPVRLIVVGAVHVAQALVPMALTLGFAVTVVDPRRAFATPERFPGVSLSFDWPDEAMAALAPDGRTAVVTLTHDPKLDDPALDVALRSPCFLHRRPRQPPHPRETRGAAPGTGPWRGRHRAHPRARRPRHRGRDGARDRLVGARRGGGGAARFGPRCAHQRTRARWRPQDDLRPHAAVRGPWRGPRAHRPPRPARAEEGHGARSGGDRRLAGGRARLRHRGPARARGRPGERGGGHARPGADGSAAHPLPRLDRAGEPVRRDGGFAGGERGCGRTGSTGSTSPSPSATLPSFVPVRAREMVATIKVIPFAVPGAVLEVATALARQEQPLLALHPFQPLKVGLVLTELPGLKEKVLEGTVEATRERVEGLCGTMLPPERCRHETPGHIRRAHRGSGGRARRCCWSRARRRWWTGAMSGPAGIVRAGGVIDHFGMPVDPGNLICLGHIDGIPSLVLPGLRALAQAQRHRLGAAAALRRAGGAADRRHGHGRGRAAERDPDPAPAPRGSRERAGAGARAAPRAAGGGAGAGGRAVAPHGAA